MNSPTLRDIIEALKRQSAGRIATVAFGLCCLVITNLFRSTPTVDAISNIIFGGLIALAIFLPGKKDS